MNIKFEAVTICNFLSFEYAEISLQNLGYTVVRGINKSIVDNSQSNGAGKSSIWEAIVWCLTGDTIRGGSKDIRNIHASDGAYVRLLFTLDDKHYDILRSKEHSQYKTNLKIFIDNKDVSGKGIRDSEKLLLEYIPELTSQFLGSVIILGQGLPQRFSSNTPSGRKDILEKLSKSDFMIEDLKKKVSNRKQVLSGELRRCEDALLISQSNYKLISQQKDAAMQSLLKLIDITTIENNLKELEEQKHQLEQEQVKTQQEIEEFDATIAKLLKQKGQEDASYKEFQGKCCVKSEEEMLLETSLVSLQINIKTLQQEIRNINNIQDVCPTCGRKLEGVVKPSTELQNQQLIAYSSEYKDVQEKLNIKSQERAKTLDIYKVAYEDNIRDIEHNLEEATCSRDKLRRVQSNLHNRLTVLFSEITQCNNELAVYNSKKESLDNQIITYDKKLSELSNEILYINSDKDNIQEHLDVINSFVTVVTRDFRGFLLQNVISYIDNRAKEYSKEIFNTDRMSFILEGNNINIVYDEKLYEDLSGGEKQKVDLIVQFSLRDMLCTFLNFSCNILVLDEIFDNLDAFGCQKVIDMISKKLTNVESIFVVTHHTDIMIPYDNEIIVEKNSTGVSSIR